MSVLFPFVPFNPVETPLSFATRLAHFHLRTSVASFLKDIGVRHEAMIGCDEGAVDRLADVAGVDATALHHNSVRRIEARRFLLRGHALTAEFFSSPDTMFCPACLREDDAGLSDVGSVRLGRLEWTLRPVRTCARHGLALVHRKRQRWDDIFRELGRLVPERGVDLDRLIAETDQRAPSPMQDYVIARLEGTVGDTWLDRQTLEQGVRSSEMLGLLVAFGPSKKPSDASPQEWDRASGIGLEITSKGEGAIRDALRDVQADAVRTVGKPGCRKLFGAFYEWLSFGKSAKDPGEITRILREHIFETMEIPAGKTVLGETLSERRLHSVESLATESGLDPRTLRRVLVASKLIPAEDNANGGHVFNAEAGRKVAGSVQRRTHVISLGKALNCTRPQAIQLLDERLILRISEDPAFALGRTRRSVDDREISRFLKNLHSDTSVVDEGPDNLVPISKAAEKAKCLCVEIVHLILGGFLENVARCRGVEGYEGFLVDPDEVQAQMATVMTGLSASAAFTRLKIPKSTGWALVLNTEGPQLRSIVIEGRNGRHRIYRFSEDAVAEFMSEFTTPTLIAARHDLEIDVVIGHLKRSGVRPVMRRCDIGIDFFRAAQVPDFETA